MTQVIKQNIYKETQRYIKRLFKNHLKKFILYGSYARNNEDNESDIDFLVLTDLYDNEYKKLDNEINNISSGLSLKYNVCISIMVENLNFFNNHLPILPFFQNVKNEGITLYER